MILSRSHLSDRCLIDVFDLVLSDESSEVLVAGVVVHEVPATRQDIMSVRVDDTLLLVRHHVLCLRLLDLCPSNDPVVVSRIDFTERA